MRHKASTFAIRMTIWVIASFSILTFSACGDDDNSTIDELLSEETTPVTFEIKKWYDRHFLFDYTNNWHHIGADTISLSSKTKEVTINMRQGKHQIIWVMGIEEYMYYEDFTSSNEVEVGLHFDAINKKFNDYPQSYHQL